MLRAVERASDCRHTNRSNQGKKFEKDKIRLLGSSADYIAGFRKSSQWLQCEERLVKKTQRFYRQVSVTRHLKSYLITDCLVFYLL